MMNLKDKVALVSGASRGIGAAILLELAKQGVIVAGTATTETGATQITSRLETLGLRGKGFVMNVAESASVNDALTAIVSEFGAPSILVNNAGITQDNLMLRMKEEQWADVINTNLTSVYRLSKACLRGMVKMRWGRIINISSVVGCTGNAGQANYSAAKAGMIAFSKSLAQEIAIRNITVNSVAPGFIATDMTTKLDQKYQDMITAQIPMERMGTPEEVAAVVGFLASPQASYITGETIHVNGGMFMN